MNSMAERLNDEFEDLELNTQVCLILWHSSMVSLRTWFINVSNVPTS